MLVETGFYLIGFVRFSLIPWHQLLALLVLTAFSPALGAAPHDPAFWKSIVDHDFAVPSGEQAGTLALEIADLAGSTDPVLRDHCGYEILAAWIYRDHRVSPNDLELLRRKLLPGMFFHIGEAGDDAIFRRSFSALYLSILAAEDLRTPFMSPNGFKDTLDAAIRSYAEEKDLRGYIPGKGWAHATAHAADLLKFLGRNDKLSPDFQKRIIQAVAQRARSADSPLVWGEDARMAAALLSLVSRNDFASAAFDEWFRRLVPQFQELWKSAAIDPKAYTSVHNQVNVLTHLSARIAADKENRVDPGFRSSLNTTLSQLN